ncbi:MAG: PKD domain-containing protein, partial [Myxococcota bacterium]
ASRSYHPNPTRSIASYQWDVDGVAGFDGGGASPRFTYTYNRFGNYTVTLRVTDDLGRRNETTLQVQVNQGNGPPVARTSAANYVVLEGDALPLDGRPSSDANANCGDAIASYEWDLNNNGRFNDAGVDVSGANPAVPWATVNALFRWPADRVTGLPTNTIALRVTDSFGLTATVNATVTIYRAIPTAVIVQSPRPAPISLRDGTSVATLDGRESSSPIPGMTIARYDWDLDNNGTFERANTPVVDLQRQFLPIPGPGNIPVVTVCLRVTDRDGRTATTCYQVQYRVPPTPPTADADPTQPPERNYHILLGDGVALDATSSFDPDTAEFQDFIQHYRWDLNADVARPVWDRDLVDANGDGREAILNLTAQELAAMGLNRAGVFPLLLEVEDTTALTSRDTATLNIYARNPVASATANPNPAACGARITLDGSASDHPHPDINVVAWNWDTDGDGQYDDQTGRIVVHQFDQFTFAGALQVGLQVTDNNGNRGTVVVPVNINQGNRPPVANPAGPYVIALNDAVTLDARGSVEPDAACGDAIVRYDWDLNADGSFEFSGANAGQQAVTWQQLTAARMGALGQYDVRLRVTDRFGVSA